MQALFCIGLNQGVVGKSDEFPQLGGAACGFADAH